MMNRRLGFASAFAAIIAGVSAMPVSAAIYRVLPPANDVMPGVTYPMRVEAETQAGDNVVGTGFFSFAIDLTVSGDAGATGSDISNVLLNEADFDDLFGNSPGHAMGDQYVDIAGVTSNFLAPTFGHLSGDKTWLFDFNFTVPPSALLNQTITLTPSEGAFENLIVNDAFDSVMPQLFEPATLTVVPEPVTPLLLTVGLVLCVSAGRLSSDTVTP